MAVEPDHNLSTTTTGGASKGGSTLTILRWVYPSVKQVTVLSEGPVVLGRDPTCSTQLETNRVSRRHAEIELKSKGFVIRDLDSKNGVFVNAERRSTSTLAPNDVVRLGDFIAVVDTATAKDLAGPGELEHGVRGGAAMRKIMEQARRSAAEGGDLVLEGEAGTGKCLVARAIHRLSGRTGAFVVAVDAATGDPSTLAAELFGATGMEKSAERACVGYFQAAERGTLVLPHVGELPLDLQAKLHAFLDRRGPAGAQAGGGVDVRLIVTTEVPLHELPPERFDPGLRARLGASSIRLPPLRERSADIIPLFVGLMRRYGDVAQGRLEPELLEHLCLRDWPMNVGELQHVARRLVAAHGAERPLRLHHLLEVLGTAVNEPLDESTLSNGSTGRRVPSTYPAAELAALRAALERHHGNLTKAAEEVGITRPKAYRMLGAPRSQA